MVFKRLPLSRDELREVFLLWHVRVKNVIDDIMSSGTGISEQEINRVLVMVLTIRSFQDMRGLQFLKLWTFLQSKYSFA